MEVGFDVMSMEFRYTMGGSKIEVPGSSCSVLVRFQPAVNAPYVKVVFEVVFGGMVPGVGLGRGTPYTI